VPDDDMAEKFKVKFLTVIWGARYIEEFARVSMPSYLAAGNIPYMAAETDLEVIILTSKDSRRKFDEDPVFEKLRAICPVRYIFIDDLITTGVYGVTLTLAYARGILDSGADQTNTHFVFMNSDFILADGSFRTLLKKFREGHPCVMAPSLRARAEAVFPQLAARVDSTEKTLTIPPRALAQLAFDNLHPTVIAKTVSQEFVTCTTHNQIYWQVDNSTLLARYHLIFMMAIKPERPMPPVNSYCDYGFVPELVPSGKFAILDDSDDFFLLELQPTEQEKQFLRSGTSTPDEIASDLSRWTTHEHRRFAEVDVVIRSGDIPAELPVEREKLAKFIKVVSGRMEKRARKHEGHFYWISGVQAWASLKYSGTDGKIVLPAELDKQTAIIAAGSMLRQVQQLGVSKGISRSIGLSYLRFLAFAKGRARAIPYVPFWHHLDLDSRLIRGWLESVRSRGDQRNILICGRDSQLPVTFEDEHFDVHIGINSFLEEENARKETALFTPPYDNAILHVERHRIRDAKKTLAKVTGLVKTGGTIALFIEHRNAEIDPSDFSVELAQYAEDILPVDWMKYHVTARFAGGLAKRRLRRAEIFLFRYLSPSSVWRIPHLVLAMAAWPMLAALTSLNNLRMRSTLSRCPAYCTSALLSFTKLP
jgi:hypothetical protein